MQDEACKQDEVRRSTVSSRSPTCNLRNLNMELSCGNTKPFTFSQQTKLLFSLPRTPPKAFECSLCPPILNPRPLLRVVVVCFGVVLPVFHGLPLSVSGVCVCVCVCARHLFSSRAKVAMLACIGYIVPEFVRFPGRLFRDQACSSDTELSVHERTPLSPAS